MAARRLLIVMLILLGLSTLAAALVPQHALRGGDTTGTTATQPNRTTTTATQNGRSLSAKILVGKKVPVVAGAVCAKREPRCEPIHVGDQLSLKVLSTSQAELEIPSFGLIGVADRNSPALFQLLFSEPTTIGIINTSTQQPTAKIEVLSAKAAAKALRQPPGKGNEKGGSTPRARGEPGQP
jgi:hypothetical protein